MRWQLGWCGHGHQGSIDRSRSRIKLAPEWLRDNASPVMAANELPAWLGPAVDAVLADMQDPTPLILDVSHRPDARAEYWGVVCFTDGTRDSLEVEVPEVPTDGSEVDVLIRLAEELPFYVAELGQFWGQARPACPGHTHGAHPVEHHGAAWWSCPVDRSLVGRIGSLPHNAR
jgi:hypothetical protein